MADRHKRNVDWWVADENGKTSSGMDGWGPVLAALLMDIRAELRTIRAQTAVLRCPSFQQIPMLLRGVRANTSRPRPKRMPRRKVA